MSPNELAIEKNIDAIRQRAKKVVALRQKQWQKDYPLFMTSCSAL